MLKSEVRSHEVRSKKLEVGSKKLETGSKKLLVRDWKSEVSWK